MDFITNLPPSLGRDRRAYNAIIVIVDRFTKFSLYKPTRKNLKAYKLAELFFCEVVINYGAPKSIISNRGSLFTSDFWSTLIYYIYIKRRLSIVYYP